MDDKISADSLELYTAIYRLGRQMHRCAHHVAHIGGIYREQSRLLMLIAENDGVIQRDLAEEMDVRPSSMTEMLAKMERMGLVQRRQDEKDQRVMHIFLTEQGKNEAEKSRGVTEKVTDALFEGLTDDEIKTMLELTEKLSRHLESMDSAVLESNNPHNCHHHGYALRHDFNGRFHHGFGRL